MGGVEDNPTIEEWKDMKCIICRKVEAELMEKGTTYCEKCYNEMIERQSVAYSRMMKRLSEI